MLTKVLKLIGGLILDFFETIVTAGILFLIIYLFLFQPHQVKGNSMSPNFEDADYLLTNKLTYHLSKPKRADIIIFQAPHNKDYDYIKRVIALPGEKLALKEGHFYINGSRLDESAYLPPNTYTTGGGFLSQGQEVTVPEGQYFAVGDNRAHSSDSRNWGFIPEENIIGKAWIRYYPFSDFGLVSTSAR